MIQKLKFYILLAFFAFANVAFAEECTLKSAADYYAEQSYEKAMTCYEELLRTGESSQLYYNYANACYKSGNMGLAILNYEKALKLNPFSKDAKFNLALANQQITDKIEPMETFFLLSWINHLGKLFSSNQWALLTILFFLLFLISVMVFLFSSWRWLRKTSFFLALLVLLFSISSFSYSYSIKRNQTLTPEAIVLTGSLVVRSAPDDSGTELFVLHEGTKLTVKSELGEWCEVTLADGNSGWIKESSIGKI